MARYAVTARTPIVIMLLAFGVVAASYASYARIGSNDWDRTPLRGAAQADRAVGIASGAYDVRVPASVAKGSVLSCWKVSGELMNRADQFLAGHGRPAATYADIRADQVDWLDARVQGQIDRYEPGCEFAAPRALLAEAERTRTASLRERAEHDQDIWVARSLALASLFGLACWATRAATNVRRGRNAMIPAFLGWVPWWIFPVLAIAAAEDGRTKLTVARWVLPLATIGIPLILLGTRRLVGRVIWEGGGLPLRWTSLAYWLAEVVGYAVIFGAATWYVVRDHDVYAGSLGDGPQEGTFATISNVGAILLAASAVLVVLFMIAASIGQHVMIVRERRDENLLIR